MSKSVLSVSVCIALLAASAAVSGAYAANDKITKTSALSLSNNAYAALVSGRNATAIKKYSIAIESRKLPVVSLGRSFLNRALAYQNSGKYKSAIGDYTAAMRLDALSSGMRAVALYNRGLAHEKTKNDTHGNRRFHWVDGGGWRVDPASLAPGPWTLVADQRVLPRALFIGEVDDRVVLDTSELDQGRVRMSGAGFGPGTRVWALAGEARLPTPLDVLSQSEDELLVDLQAAEDLPDPLDLMVLSAGYQLALVDVRGEPAVDTGAPHDTGEGTSDDTGGPDPKLDKGAGPTPQGCGCQAGPGLPSAALVVTLLLLVRRRSS